MKLSTRSHAGAAVAVSAFIALVFVQVPAAGTTPTTVAELQTALCVGVGATVTLEQNITDASAVLTVTGGCKATLDLNGHTLTVARVVLDAGADLRIRDTSASAGGQLIAVAGVTNQAGIRTTGATLRIESGIVTATGGFVSGAGIGGDFNGSGGTVTVSGGTVTAEGGPGGAGIGGGEYGISGGAVTVSGGTVTARGGSDAAGIGGGDSGSGGTITVSGGTVTATGGSDAAGIGGGNDGPGGTITISAGTVTATSRFTSAFYGIGPGLGRTGGVVTIGPGLVRTDTEPAAGRRTTTLTPVPVPVPAAVPVLVLSCVPSVPVVGGLVTCTVTGGDAGVEILWRAAYNPVIAEAGVTLGADGSGTFSFVVPRAALGEPLMVELVEWTAPMSLGVSGGPVPTSVPSGGGPVPVWPLGLLALAGVLALRRRALGPAGG